MKMSRFLQQAIEISLVIPLLVGCASSTTAPALPTPLSQTTQADQSGQTTGQPGQPAQQNNPPALDPAQTSVLNFIQTLQVTPDAEFLTGSFARIHYVPATDHFVVTFGTKASTQAGVCNGTGYAYKEYNMEMQETGNSGHLIWYENACEAGDSGSVMVDNNLYYALVPQEPGQSNSWHLLKIDATNWTTLIDIYFPVDYPEAETIWDPMVAFVNGQLDISSDYNVSGEVPDSETPAGTYGTYHYFFSPDLQFQRRLILTEPPHIMGSYMVYLEGIYYLVTADRYDGDVLLAKYDTDWRYLGGKTLIEQAHFSTGLVYDDQRFYLAYTDTSQRSEVGFFPVSLNIHLAAFDRDWNLLEDVAVTNYAPQDGLQPGRPWVTLHDNRLYVSYDMDTTDPVTREEHLQWQAYVSVYELVQGVP